METTHLSSFGATEQDLKSKLIGDKTTYLCISHTCTDLKTNVKQFLSQRLNMPIREINKGMYVAKMPQPKTA